MFSLERLFTATPSKTYFLGTHRAALPETTWTFLQPLLFSMGITRVANVTGLDRIGIPVYMSCRPNSRSLAVFQGKGIDAISAKVSAVMESVESWHAEFNQCSARLETYAELRRSASVCDPAALPLCKGSLFSNHRPLPWVAGIDLLSGETVWVPYELVHANATLPPVPGSNCFVSSTNGLASGNNLTEAVLHALYEVIERDALALWEFGTPNRWSARRVECASITGSYCMDLLERYRAADIAVMVWDITSDVGLPAFVAIIYDEESHAVLRPIPAAFGSGCHCDSGVALARALTEAAQSRLTGIAGSRDDQTRSRYHTAQSEAALDYHRRLARDRHAPVHFQDSPCFSGTTLADDLRHVLACLRRVSIQRAIAVDLSRPDYPVSVVRVIVPGLEGPSESAWYRPGPRLKARLEWTPSSS